MIIQKILTDGVQPKPVRVLAVDGIAGHTTVPSGVVAVDVGHVDDAGVSLCKGGNVTAAGLMLPDILDGASPVFQIAAHPHYGSFHWRHITHQEVRLTDGYCIHSKDRKVENCLDNVLY